MTHQAQCINRGCENTVETKHPVKDCDLVTCETCQRAKRYSDELTAEALRKMKARK